jgi:hypothetical protein
MLDNVIAQVLPEKNELEKLHIDTDAYVRQAAANLDAQMGTEKEHTFLNLLQQSTGINLMPSAPQIPTGTQPARGASPLPQKGATKSPTQPKGKVLVEGVDF